MGSLQNNPKINSMGACTQNLHMRIGRSFSLLSFRVRVSSGRGRFRVLVRLRGESCFALVFVFTSLAAVAAVAAAASASVYSLVFATIIMSEKQETEDDQTLDVQASRLTCNNPSAFINARDPDTNSPCAPKADNHTAAYYAKTQDPSGRMAGKPGDPSDLHGRGGYFIAVHVGAGYHAPQNSRAYRRVMRRACWAAAEILSQNSGTSIDAVAAAIRVLEDDEITNAGRGSNLTEDGQVECDASIMDGSSGAFGAVGALPGVRNPIDVALLLAKKSLCVSPLGRIPPIFLVGEGAREWALNHGVCTAAAAEEAAEWLVTKKAEQRWEKYTCMLQSAASALDQSSSLLGTQKKQIQNPVQGAGKDLKAAVNKMDVNDIKGNGQKSTDKDPGTGGDIMSNKEKMGDHDIIMDTVGAICIDYAGNLATGVSSGGIAMKVKGRVGMAAAYGCGCWAGAKSKLSGISTACAFTGAGEQIVQSIAAHECCVLATQSEEGPGFACEKTLLSVLDKRGCLKGSRDAGVLLLQAESTSVEGNELQKLTAVELVAAYSSPSFGIGYFGTCLKEPKTMILRRTISEGIEKVSIFGSHFVFSQENFP